MAAVTTGVSATTSVDNSALTTGSFTPALGDLLIAFGGVGGQSGGGTFTDSQGLTWTQVTSALRSASAATLVCSVANAFAANAAMTVTFTPAGAPTDTGICIAVLRVSGMSKFGAAAIVQSAKEENQAAAGTPAPTFAGSAVTSNPTIGAVHNVSNPATMTEPTGWTERYDIGDTIPNNGLEVVSRDSGFTGTTVTWGSASATGYSDIIVELDASQQKPAIPLIVKTEVHTSQFLE